MVAVPPQAVTMTPAPTMASTRAERWHTDSEATVGDIFPGDIASTRQATAQDIRVASPSSSRASKHDDSDDSFGELSSAGELRSARCLSDSNRGEQLATPSTKKKAGGKRKRAPSTRYSTNKELPSWKSDQPTGVLRAPAKPMVPWQPQCAAPSAEPALQIIHGDNDWMQSRGPQGLITLGWIMPVKGKPKPLGHLVLGSQSGAPWLG
jgi:hypothetical protein